MYWQVRSDMYFRMAGGWTGISPFEFARMPIVNYFYGGIDLPEAGDQLKAYLARFDVHAVIADPIRIAFRSSRKRSHRWVSRRQRRKASRFIRFRGSRWPRTPNFPAAQVEARANALRFDTIVEAAAKYPSGGNDPSKLSPLELKRLNLLPSDWLIDSTPHAYTDWEIAPAPAGRVGIIIVGSYEGVRPLIARYRATASEIQYPAPTRWTPD